MKNLGLILSTVVATCLLFASCSTNRYHTTRIQNLDFGQYKTYGWLPPVDSLSKDYYNNDIAKDNILSTANREIERRGLTYSKDNPDVLFRYVAIVNNKSKMVYASPYNYGWGWGGWGGWYRPWGYYAYAPSFPVGKERVRYGHIVLEAVDREKNSVVWQARGTNEVNNPEKAINELPKIVQGIMKQYPVKIE